MVLLSTTACLVLYALCSLALLRLQWTGQIVDARRSALPLAIVGVLATLYSLWAVVGAGVEAVAWGAVLLALGAPLYLVVRLTKTPRLDVNPPPSVYPNRNADR
jgi:APA family basic amino acid/polyamine antiporter